MSKRRDLSRYRAWRTALACRLALFMIGLLCSASAGAVPVRVTLTGTITEIVAEDANGNDDTAGFKAILPFDVGSRLISTLWYDTEARPDFSNSTLATYQDGTYRHRMGATSFTGDLRLDVFKSFPNFGYEFFPFGFNPFNAPGWDWDSGGITVGFPEEVRILLKPGLTFGYGLTPPDTSIDPDEFNLTFISEMRAQAGPDSITSPLGTHAGMYHRIDGVYTGLQVTVIPEPASALGLLLGTVVLTRRRTR